MCWQHLPGLIVTWRSTIGADRCGLLSARVARLSSPSCGNTKSRSHDGLGAVTFVKPGLSATLKLSCWEALTGGLPVIRSQCAAVGPHLRDAAEAAGEAATMKSMELRIP